MKIGDIVRDKVINQLATVTDFGFDNEVEEEYIVIQLCDGSEVLASYEELEVINGSR